MLLGNFDHFDLCSMEKFGTQAVSAPSATTHEVEATESRVVGLQSMFKMHRSELKSPVAFH